MVFAIAALLLHFGPAVPAAALPTATAVAALPDAPTASAAPVATTATPNAAAPANALPAKPVSDNSETRPAVLRLAALDKAGNNTQILSTIHIPEANSKPLRRISVEVPSRRSWLALSLAQSGAAAFDAYATRQAIENGAHEADPFMRPFANSSGIYGAIQVCPIVLDFTARRMQRSENPMIRHTWWLPQALGTGLYIFSGAHDLQVASRH